MSQFSDLALAPALLDRLAAARFTTPTPVQEATIPPALAGGDVLATAQTGTGKTLAFLLPILHHLLREGTPRTPRAVQPRPGVAALVLTPTRELAMQIASQFEQLRPRSLPAAALLVGGMSERPQLDALFHGARLAVATPGRLEDFLQRKRVSLTSVQVLVLDEVDRMLDSGFLPAIRRILATLPRERQTLCYSATLPPEVAKLTRECMANPQRICLGAGTRPAPDIELRAYEVADGEKLPLLQSLLGNERGRCLVFARTKRGTERLAKALIRDGFTAAMIHGNRSQSQRTKALAGFQGGQFQVLVATDVAARGIHVDHVAHVINFDLPDVAEDFVHRVGRTGRAGARGLATTFVHRSQRSGLLQLEKQLGIRLQRLSLAQKAAANRGNVATP